MSIHRDVVIKGNVGIGKRVVIEQGVVIKARKRERIKIDNDVVIMKQASINGSCHISAGTIIYNNVIIGTKGKGKVKKYARAKKFAISHISIGSDSEIRPFTVIYNNVKIGNEFKSGVGAIVREYSIIGEKCIFGTYASTDGYTIIGDFCHIGQYTQLSQSVTIGNCVFVGGHTAFSDNKFIIPSSDYAYNGAVVEDFVRIGLNCTILSGVRIGKGALVGAGSVITKDVPQYTLVYGVPATKVRELTKNEIEIYSNFLKRMRSR